MSPPVDSVGSRVKRIKAKAERKRKDGRSEEDRSKRQKTESKEIERGTERKKKAGKAE